VSNLNGWCVAGEALQSSATLTVGRVSVWAHASKIFVAAAFVAALQAALAPPAAQQQLLPGSPEVPSPQKQQQQQQQPGPPAHAPRSPVRLSRSLRASIGGAKVPSPGPSLSMLHHPTFTPTPTRMFTC